MRIGTRISVGFLSFTVLLVVVLIYQYATILRVVDLTTRLSAINYDMGQGTVRLQNDLALVEEFTAKFFISSDPEPYASDLIELFAEIGQKLSRFRKLDVSKSELDQLTMVSEEWDQFERILRPWLETKGVNVPVETAREVDAALVKVIEEVRRLLPITRRQLEAADDAAREAGKRALTVALVAVLVAVVMGPMATFFIVRSITGPLETLTAATRRLAAGDFSARIQPPEDEDMAGLARDFNSMVRDLQELEQHKKEFFSTISHELKAPLASMQETTGLLLEGLAGELPARQRKMLQLNHRSGDRLMRLLNNILDYSRLEVGALRHEFREASLQPVLQDVVRGFQGLIQERQSQVELDLPGDGVVLSCDPERLSQVFRNLLDNALKYSPPESTIRVELQPNSLNLRKLPKRIRESLGSRETHWVRIDFRDQATSIPAGEQEQIFRRYHQTQGRPIRSGGVGLGLAISRSIVRAHDGFIWVEEVGKEGGNCFSVILRREGPVADLLRRKQRRNV